MRQQERQSIFTAQIRQPEKLAPAHGMNETNPSGLSQELLDDFFTEADQHLLNIRNALLGFETSGSEANYDPQIIGQLFLDFHSFKGISAIVGLEPAESLAHATEDLLRLMRSGKVQPNDKLLNALSGATRKLEQIVAALREKKPLPGYESELNEIKSQCPDPLLSEAAAPQSKRDPASFAEKSKKGQRATGSVFKFTFSPSLELNAKKININTIREELLRVGKIVKSTPVVKGKGVIVFEFLVATNQVLKNTPEWKAKGVTIEFVNEPELPESGSADDSQVIAEDTHNPFLAPSHIVRVDLKRLDDLLRIVGEMVIHRSRLDIELARLSHAGNHVDLRGVHEVNRMLGRSLRQMREDIMGIRLVPIREIFARLPFVIRDLARQSSKKVRLEIEGEETAIDKYLIEHLKDPLLHMVRNAFSHGIETAAERKAASKPEEATIKLSAFATAGSVVIKVRDDGKGVNVNAILQRAKQLGLEAPATDNDAILGILCSPGFSIRDDADRMSGRGVGMAVVQSAVKELGGKLSLETEEGRGTQFTLKLPLTVVIAETFLVSAAGQTCAVPQSSVREILHTTEEDIRTADGIEMVSYRGGVLPLTRLAGLFRLKNSNSGLRCILVITSERGSVGLLVDKVIGQREVVVRTIRDPLIQVPGISGVTEIGDGKPVLILDGVALTTGSVRPANSSDFAQ
ncbi:MAG TPA: chemotaxis protein CheA [Verrucomicrobiae bacterium]